MINRIIYIKKKKYKLEEDDKGNKIKREETGQDIANRIISYLEMFMENNSSSKDLDKFVNFSKEQELNEINKDIDEYRDKLIKKIEDEDFDYVKEMIMRRKCMYSISHKPEKIYDSDYPQILRITKSDFDKLMNYNSGLIDDGKILGMIVEIINDKKGND